MKRLSITMAVFFTLTLLASSFGQGIQELNEVRALLDNGKNQEAEKAAQGLLKTVESKYGMDSIDTAKVLDLLVEAMIGNRNQVGEEIKALIERSISIRKRVLGPEHAEISERLYDFSRLYWKIGDYAGSMTLVEQALAAAKKTHGSDSREVGRILHGYAWVLQRTGDLARAKGPFEEALKITERELGPTHLEVASILNNLGLLLKDTGQFKEARSCMERTLAIREQELGPEHREVAFAVDNLASLLHVMGDYARAKNLYVRNLPILEKEFGLEHPRTANCLNDLGYLLNDMGDFVGAMQNHERALKIREKIYGFDHPAVAYSLNNLAVVLRHTGDYVRARSLLERCLVICEAAFGSDHQNVAMILNNIANVLDDMGKPEEAEPYIRRAFDIQEKALGPDNFELVPFLGNYAIELKVLGKLDLAYELLQRALAIQERNLGPHHPEIALSLINIAEIHNLRGMNNEALDFIKRAKSVTEKSAGPDHPLMAKIHRDFSLYLWAAGKPNEAFENALRSEEITRNKLRLFTGALSERQALAYASEKTNQGLDICLSLAKDSSHEIDGAVERAWDSCIQSRALILDEMAVRHRKIVETDDPEVTGLADDLASARQHLANIVVAGPSSSPSEEGYRSLLDKASEKKELAERLLAQASTSFKGRLERRQAGIDKIKSSLPPGFALVAYSRYSHHFPHQPGSTTSFVAFVFSDKSEKPAIILLGEAGDIETLVFDWSQEAAYGTRIQGRTVKEFETAYRDAGTALRRKVWDPLIPYIEGAKCILMVQEGPLHLVNFYALPGQSGKYLIDEEFLIHYLSAERDILNSDASRIHGNGLLALGAPDFDTTSLYAAYGPEGKSKQGFISRIKSIFSFRGMHSECANFKSLTFEPLPATDKEIKQIADIWEKSERCTGEVFALAGAEANEAAFKMSSPGKQILHIATHGFFLEGDCPSAISIPDEYRDSDNAVMQESVQTVGENPLILSGLALAGATHRESAGPGEEDGILTAEEVASLDLSGVDWAVLSACLSGSGRIITGEGVFGLRRAFLIAGARTIITSLWAVEDEATKMWMKRLYEARFRDGKPTAECVREASLRTINELRRRRKSTHPFYWAGFVAAGDWR